MKTNTTLTLGIGLLWAWTAPFAHAFTYADEDLLLIFRKPGFNDVEFNLGSISNLLTRAEGSDTAVTGWDPALVKSQYDLNDGAQFVLLAATSGQAAQKRVWISSADPTATVLNQTASGWRVLWSKIDGVGRNPVLYGGLDSKTSYVVSPSDLSSYSFIASNSGAQAGSIPTLGGLTSFVVEQGIPGSLALYEIAPSTVNPKPAARKVGTFSLSAGGELRFLAGSGSVQPPQPTEIVGIATAGGKVSVSFKSVAGVQYRLRSSSDFGTPHDAWTALSASVQGTGEVLILQDDAPENGARFYLVESFR